MSNYVVKYIDGKGKVYPRGSIIQNEKEEPIFHRDISIKSIKWGKYVALECCITKFLHDKVETINYFFKETKELYSWGLDEIMKDRYRQYRNERWQYFFPVGLKNKIGLKYTPFIPEDSIVVNEE